MRIYNQKLLYLTAMVMLLGLVACNSGAATPAQPAAQSETVAEQQQQAEATATTPALTPEAALDEEPAGKEAVDEAGAAGAVPAEAGATEAAAATEDDDALISAALSQSETAAADAILTQQYGMVISQLNDRGFNDLAWAGMQQAAAELGVAVQFAQDTNPATGPARIDQFIIQGYDGIIAVGLEYAAALEAAALANPDIDFAIVDFPNQTDNDRGMLFETDGPAFLAGYLAAGMSQSGLVCTYGGKKIPSVMIFMVGFEHGVNYYNTQKATGVELLGWTTDDSNPSGGDGVFAGNFSDQHFGRIIAAEFAAQGCDIIFPVAGAVGLGTAEVAADNNLTLIGVDADQAVSNPDYADLYLTSVIKQVDRAVFETVSQMAAGTFVGGNNYIGILADEDVGLAPFHSFTAQVPSELEAELATLAQGLNDGSIMTGWPVGASRIEAGLTSGPLGLVPLRNATYSLELAETGQVTLSNGRAQVSSASGGGPTLQVTLADYVAYGDLTGDGEIEAAVILATSNDAEVIYNLVAVAAHEGVVTPLGSVSLGSDITLNALGVEEDLIKVVISSQAAAGSQQRVVKFFGLLDEQLEELSSQVVQ